jgi:hypothetical protein
MALTNNGFSKDSDAQRTDRTLLMEGNIDRHAGTIGITGDTLTWAQACHTNWQDIMSAGDVEAGQAVEAHEEYQKAYEACHSYYQSAKDALLAIIYQHENPDKIDAAYCINTPTPKMRA